MMKVVEELDGHDEEKELAKHLAEQYSSIEDAYKALKEHDLEKKKHGLF